MEVFLLIPRPWQLLKEKDHQTLTKKSKPQRLKLPTPPLIPDTPNLSPVPSKHWQRKMLVQDNTNIFLLVTARISVGGLSQRRSAEEDACPKPVALVAMLSPSTVFSRLEKIVAGTVSKGHGRETQNAKPGDQWNPKPLILESSFFISVACSYSHISLLFLEPFPCHHGGHLQTEGQHH